MGELQKMYKTVQDDHFPRHMEISFFDDPALRQSLLYERVMWDINGEKKGLRYGENPGQEAALYRLTNGNLTLGNVTCIQPGRWLASDAELLQSGKHPGKTNITDVDNALNILRYFRETPMAVIVKHNNPCGAAKGASLAEAYRKAYFADRIAAFGGAVTVNRAVDKETAEAIASSYTEVVAAPEFEEGVLDIFAKHKNLRVMRINAIENLSRYIAVPVLDYKALIDGGIIVQTSYIPKVRNAKDLLKAETEYKGQHYEVRRQPTEREADDMIFGWLVESGITSNSVIFVKDGATVAIGTGEQDRVGVAEIAVDKAYRKRQDCLAFEKYGTPWALLEDELKRGEIIETVKAENAGLKNSVMVSDAFFPFRDGIDVGLKQGVSAVVQPGGSIRDFEVIEACNEYGAAMMFTGERSFKH